LEEIFYKCRGSVKSELNENEGKNINENIEPAGKNIGVWLHSCG